ncbi:unnamed protein product [Schistosoma rodhaini]|nr:unnamed protein product [Schistosoma rodhaini]
MINYAHKKPHIPPNSHLHRSVVYSYNKTTNKRNVINPSPDNFSNFYITDYLNILSGWWNKNNQLVVMSSAQDLFSNSLVRNFRNPLLSNVVHHSSDNFTRSLNLYLLRKLNTQNNPPLLNNYQSGSPNVLLGQDVVNKSESISETILRTKLSNGNQRSTLTNTPFVSNHDGYNKLSSNNNNFNCSMKNVHNFTL